jgi:GTP pyrophosphokinase
MNTIKWELEDLSFATLYPKVYDEIVRLVAERAPAREDYLARVREQVSADLRAAKIKAVTTGRPKHYYSVYQKMIVRGPRLRRHLRPGRRRVLVDSVRDCYAVLGALHARWNPVPGRFKDYIAMPKFNMYQSLHTTVIGPEGKPVEIQIRTHQMHRRAEYGVAAHWKYKDDPNAGVTAAAPNDMAVAAPAARLAARDQRPRRVPRLPALRDQRAGGVRLHAEGRRRRAARRVDAGRLRLRRAHRGRPPLHGRAGQRPARAAGEHARQRRRRRDLHLQGGRRGPSRDWLTFVPEPAGAQQDPAVVLEGAPRGGDRAGQGRHRQGDAQAGLPIQRSMSHESLVALATEMRYPDVSGLYAGGRRRARQRASVVQRLVQTLGGEEGARRTSPRPPPRRACLGPAPATPASSSRAWTPTSGSSSPSAARRYPGDPIMGLRDPRQRRLRAPQRLQQRRRPAGRSPSGSSTSSGAPTAGSVFLVQDPGEALERSRLLSDITRVLSDNPRQHPRGDGLHVPRPVAISRFTFEMAATGHLDHVISAVRKIEGVFDAYRVTGNRID